jgi:hypothetical protein
VSSDDDFGDDYDDLENDYNETKIEKFVNNLKSEYLSSIFLDREDSLYTLYEELNNHINFIVNKSELVKEEIEKIKKKLSEIDASQLNMVEKSAARAEIKRQLASFEASNRLNKASEETKIQDLTSRFFASLNNFLEQIRLSDKRILSAIEEEIENDNDLSIKDVGEIVYDMRDEILSKSEAVKTMLDIDLEAESELSDKEEIRREFDKLQNKENITRQKMEESGRLKQKQILTDEEKKSRERERQKAARLRKEVRFNKDVKFYTDRINKAIKEDDELSVEIYQEQLNQLKAKYESSIIRNRSQQAKRNEEKKKLHELRRSMQSITDEVKALGDDGSYLLSIILKYQQAVDAKKDVLKKANAELFANNPSLLVKRYPEVINEINGMMELINLSEEDKKDKKNKQKLKDYIDTIKSYLSKKTDESAKEIEKSMEEILSPFKEFRKKLSKEVPVKKGLLLKDIPLEAVVKFKLYHNDLINECDKLMSLASKSEHKALHSLAESDKLPLIKKLILSLNKVLSQIHSFEETIGKEPEENEQEIEQLPPVEEDVVSLSDYKLTNIFKKATRTEDLDLETFNKKDLAELLKDLSNEFAQGLLLKLND